MRRILVIGATGRVGREVVSQLPASEVQVRALARNPENASLPPHVQVVRGDLTAPETLDDGLRGVDSVFLVWTAPRPAFPAALAQIAKHARRIVFLSAPIKTPDPFFQQPNPIRTMTEDIEQRIEASGMEWTYLRPGMFASNAVLWWQSQIRAGDIVRWPYLAAPTAPIDDRDIAAAGVRALCEDGHAGAEYVLTGPQSLTQADQISTIGEVLGRPLRAVEITPEEARSELLALFPLFVIDMLLNAWAAAMGRRPHMTPTFEELTGRPPRTFRQWATDHAPVFRV